MQRRQLSAVVCLAFAVYWALQWPWVGTAGQPPNSHLYGWLPCIFFAVLSLGLAAGRRWARWLTLAACIGVSALLTVALIGAYFLSFFGDQVLSPQTASPLLGGIAFSVTLAVLLAYPPHTSVPSLRSPIWLPIAFSAAYFLAAWALGYYGGSGAFENVARFVGTFVGLVLVALPSIVLIWLAWAWWSRGQTSPPIGILLAAGLIIPIAVVAVEFAIFATDTALKRSRTQQQLSNAHMSEVADEVLRSPRGNPIGIRLRYTVRFDQGLDDIRYRPMVSLRFDSRSAGMWEVRSETDPSIRGSFAKSDYRMTDDFIPGYFPGFMRFPDAPQRADDRCFDWAGADREKVLRAGAERATISVSFASSPDTGVIARNSSSGLAYSQKTFYNGALKEGARECK